MEPTLDRKRLLAELGYGAPEALARALEVLYASGLTNPRKTGIAASKEARVREVLADTLIRRCARCAADGRGDGRIPVPVEDPRQCDSCGGSANRVALARAADACRRGGIGRVLVVGGAPGVHAALSSEWPTDLALRIVSGTSRHTRQDAAAQLAWADVVLVWGATQLDHRVSDHYTRAGSPKVVVVRRRGIEALADALAEHVGDR
ncbi:MAG: hypothetical protein U0167_09755 [bacterium]